MKFLLALSRAIDALNEGVGRAVLWLVLTNTIALSAASASCKKIRQLSAAPLLAETIKRISQEESVSSLFLD